MKFNISQSELHKALGVVSKGVSNRATISVLFGVLIIAEGDSIILRTTDTVRSIEYSLPALIEEPGSTVVPAKLLGDIVKTLPDAAVTIVADKETANVTCERSNFVLKAMDPQDFPSFPSVDVLQQVVLPFESFSRMVKRVAKVVSKDESRAILTGVLLDIQESTLKMVATDSYRLAVNEIGLPYDNEPFKAVIAGSFLSEIASLPADTEEIKLALSENQIMVTFGSTVFVNRRIEGSFPNYKQLLPDSYETKITFKTDELISAVKRTSLLSNTTSPLKFDIDSNSQSTQLSTVTQDVGSAREVISTPIEGPGSDIAFNYAYVLDGLSNMGTENVDLEIQGSMRPGIFRAQGENYLYLVMPVRLS